uniref:Retrovirus-related Pol polyprotein from transposon TNT 1-94 n=1 Tax=Tanacetum cinerariifolium TaxID=118510 RepID=A0A6L2P5E8_TANCI|nr:retrovirus-related Pol polyprotein from transposon TNT 1-94 [Tanacetum cinerariifolium]
MNGNLKLLINFVWKFIGTVRFGNDHVAAIMGFGDLQWGNILITRVFNLFSVGQFYDSDLKVAFRRNACFVRNLKGVDLLKGDHSINLYTINLYDMAYASPICLMACASSTKSWLWRQRLSHLNFNTINDIAKNDLVLGSKDEAPEVIKTFLKRITVLLQSHVIIRRTDNGTEFKNHALKEYFDSVGISHQVKENQEKDKNQIKTKQKQEACQSQEKFKAVAVGRARKTEQNTKRMVENAYTSMIGELNFLLGLQIKQIEDIIFFNQSKYIKEMFGLEDSKPTKPLMSTEIKLTKDDETDFVDSSKYQENPMNTHLEAVKRISRCIKGTSHLGLWYPKGTRTENVVYADSDYAGDYVDCKITSGVFTFMGCCLTSWFAKKQMALAIFTTKAKYVSAEKACQQALWMKQALIDYGIRLKNVPIMFTFHKHVMDPLDILRNPSTEKGKDITSPPVISSSSSSSDDNKAPSFLKLYDELSDKEVPTASEESSHCQKKKDATAKRIALLSKSQGITVIEFGDSYEVPASAATTKIASDGTGKKYGRTVTVTTEDMQKRKNDVKARTTLLRSLPDEHQL